MCVFDAGGAHQHPGAHASSLKQVGSRTALGCAAAEDRGLPLLERDRTRQLRQGAPRTILFVPYEDDY